MQLFFTYSLPCETKGGKLWGNFVQYSASALPKFASFSSKIENLVAILLFYNMLTALSYAFEHPFYVFLVPLYIGMLFQCKE